MTTTPNLPGRSHGLAFSFCCEISVDQPNDCPQRGREPRLAGRCVAGVSLECPIDIVSAAPASPTNDNGVGTPHNAFALFALAGFSFCLVGTQYRCAYNRAGRSPTSRLSPGRNAKAPVESLRSLGAFQI